MDERSGTNVVILINSTVSKCTFFVSILKRNMKKET